MTPQTHPHRLEAPWLRDPEIRRVVAALRAGGAEARFVGGCVRDALLGRPVADLDLAVDTPPQDSTRILESAGFRVAPTGFEHGTVTAVLEERPDRPNAARALEITSLRRDVATDGRRAVVAFTRDWAEDAARRDFTMNALYAEIDGLVHDPLGTGLTDLAARRVRFIGRAEDRIREDYLRILRFFRFAAWYGVGEMDAEGMEAVARLAQGMELLARERVGQEIRRLLAAPEPSSALSAMEASGAMAHTLPGAAAALIGPLRQAEAATAATPGWPRRLAALYARPDDTPDAAAARLDPAALTDQLRLSRADAARLTQLALAMTLPPAEAGWRCGREAARDALTLATALARLRGQTVEEAAWAAVETGAAAVFPLRAGDLTSQGLEPGPALGAALKAAERAWIDSGFTLSHAELRALAVDKGRSC